MDIKPIKTELDYQAALKEIEVLMDAYPEIPEGDRLDVMTTLVKRLKRNTILLRLPIPLKPSCIAWKL